MRPFSTVDGLGMVLKLFICVAAYLLGSIPSGLLLTRFSNVKDIRAQGSGNIGASNVFRVAGKSLGLLTFFADFLKGAVPVCIALFFSPDIVSLVAVFAVLGHVFPIWLRFKGGKGVATSMGALSLLSPLATLLSCLVWLGVIRLTRYASLSSLLAFTALPFFMLVLGQFHLLLLGAILWALALFTHRENIYRLCLKTELKINENRGSKKHGEAS